jgi:hypothetical protein
VPTTGFDQSGRAVPGQNVTYQLGSGVSGTVFVPQTVTDPAAIKALIDDDATRTHTIATLTSES